MSKGEFNSTAHENGDLDNIMKMYINSDVAYKKGPAYVRTNERKTR